MAIFPSNAEQQQTETARLEAFSDGVFAIAITLLILDIKISPAVAEESGLLTALVQQWPAFFAFVTSFATIGIMWMNHHRLFTVIGRADHVLLVLNGLLLFGITFVPFPTSLLSEYMGTKNATIAALVYGGTFVGIAIIFNTFWRYASHNNRLIAHDADPQRVAIISYQYRFGPLLYVVALLLALVSVPLSIAAHLGLAVFYALPGRLTRA